MRQISLTEEFQIIYVDSLPSKREASLSTPMRRLHGDGLLNSTVWKGGRAALQWRNLTNTSAK